MPELPEVEVAARNLRRWLVERTVEKVEVEAPRMLRPAKPEALSVLVGAQAIAVERRGKNLLLSFAGKQGPIGVHAHLGMTGKWLRREAAQAAPRFSRLRLFLDDGSVLHDCDLRLFGRFRLVPGARFDEVPELAALGPDPLADGIDAASLMQRLSKMKKPVKAAIMEQSLLPGVGNIQASEALFRARIDPRRSCTSLIAAECKRIASGVLSSVKDTIRDFERAGDDAGNGADVAYVEEGAENTFAVYDRAGEPCPRCKKAKRAGANIERVMIAGRSTFFCARCQS